jgi:septum formation protein
MKIILASKSIYRRHALDILGLEYDIIPSNIDESIIRHEDPMELAQLLSRAKARKIGKDNSGSIVISADLFVVYNSKIIEKPKDIDQAREMLRMFSGNTFDIITGLAVYNTEKNQMLSSAESCQVRFRQLTEFEINDYVSSFPVLKCAGAFEADGLLRFAEHISGSYNFKAGMSVNRLVEFLRENDILV